MTARKIEARRNRKLGTVRQGLKGKEQELKILCVYPSDQGPVLPVVEVRVPSNSVPGGTTAYFLTLQPETAMEAVKGILQNVPGVYAAADDEFLAIVKQIEGDAKRDVEAINRVLAERRGDTINLPDPRPGWETEGQGSMADDLDPRDGEDQDS